MNRWKRIDSIPGEFPSYEAAAEFWGEHDTTDYPDAFRTVKATTSFRRRYYQIEIEEDVARALRARARRRKVSMGRLASDLLRQHLINHT